MDISSKTIEALKVVLGYSNVKAKTKLNAIKEHEEFMYYIQNTEKWKTLSPQQWRIITPIINSMKNRLKQNETIFEFYSNYHQVKHIRKEHQYFLNWHQLTNSDILEICQCLSTFGWSMRLWKGNQRLIVITEETKETKNHNFVKERIKNYESDIEDNRKRDHFASDYESDSGEESEEYGCNYSTYTFIPAAKIPNCFLDVPIFKFDIYKE